MRIQNLIAVAATLIAPALATPAFAQYHQPQQQTYSPWSFGGSFGTDVAGRGDLHGAGVSNSVNLATLNPAASGTGVIRIRARDFGDIYENSQRATLEVRYATTEMSELFGAISYNTADGKLTEIGCFEATSGTTCNAVVSGDFSDLVQYGIEVGYRQWIGIGLLGDTVKPYYALRAGAVRTDGIDVTVSAGANNLANLRLTEETWSGMVGVDLGASMAVTNNIELGAEVGIRYTSMLGEDDSQLSTVGLEEINNTEGTLTVPVSVRMNVVF
jgi:hypothetical protein